MFAKLSSRTGCQSGGSISFFAFLVTLLTSNLSANAISPVQVPYNPWYIDNQVASNQSAAFILAPKSKSTSFELQQLDLTKAFSTSNPPITVVDKDIPFTNGHQSSTQSFAVGSNGNGSLAVYVGDCRKNSSATMYMVGSASMDRRPAWRDMRVSGDNNPQFLSSMIAYQNTSGPTYYVLGGMCPGSSIDTNASADWISKESYSSELTEIATGEDSYQATTIPENYGPIAQAGYTLTPLNRSSDDSSSGNSQRLFTLIGGHTHSGSFNNISIIGLLSLPDQTWTFEEVESDTSGLSGDAKTTGFEPRTGHSTVLSSDGKKIFVIGGWVGDTSHAAQPQLAILDIPKKYGGDTESWKWRVPKDSDKSPFKNGEGLYGHAAAMLPGGFVMVVGGYKIPASSDKSSSRRRRTDSGSGSDALLFNADKESWEESYSSTQTDGNKPSSGGSSGLSHGGAIALGLCLGIGFLVLFGLVCFFLRRKNRNQMRESQLPPDPDPTIQERGEITPRTSSNSNLSSSKRSSANKASARSSSSSHARSQGSKSDEWESDSSADTSLSNESRVSGKDATRHSFNTNLGSHSIPEASEKDEKGLSSDTYNSPERPRSSYLLRDSNISSGQDRPVSNMTAFLKTIPTDRSKSIGGDEPRPNQASGWTDSALVNHFASDPNAPYSPINRSVRSTDMYANDEMPERKGSLAFPFDYKHSISAYVGGEASLSNDWSSLRRFTRDNITSRRSQNEETPYPTRYTQPEVITTSPSPRSPVHEGPSPSAGAKIDSPSGLQVTEQARPLGFPRRPTSAYRDLSKWRFQQAPLSPTREQYMSLRRSISDQNSNSAYSWLQRINEAGSDDELWSLFRASERSLGERLNRQSSRGSLAVPSFAPSTHLSRISSLSNWPLPRTNEARPPQQNPNARPRFSSSPMLYPTTHLSPDQADFGSITPKNRDSLMNRRSNFSNCGSI